MLVLGIISFASCAEPRRYGTETESSMAQGRPTFQGELTQPVGRGRPQDFDRHQADGTTSTPVETLTEQNSGSLPPVKGEIVQPEEFDAEKSDSSVREEPTPKESEQQPPVEQKPVQQEQGDQQQKDQEQKSQEPSKQPDQVEQKEKPKNKIEPWPKSRWRPPRHQPKNPPGGSTEFPSDALKSPVKSETETALSSAQESTKGEDSKGREPKQEPTKSYFDFATGKPHKGYTRGVTRRFGAKANRGVALESLTLEEQQKTLRIFNEIRKAIDVRSPQHNRRLLIVESDDARTLSERFEKEGVISSEGAWTVAVKGTAVRYGFRDRPCAEFVSEILRQAYERAGYSVEEDFSYEKGLPLVLYQTASVYGLSATLYKAGWIAWDASIFKPPMGAIGMHGNGMTPGHTYMIAGENGLLIVDNGSPLGKDLRKTTPQDIAHQYETGVFFLPKGINPQPW